MFRGFPELGVPYSGPYCKGILLFADLYWGCALFSYTPDVVFMFLQGCSSGFRRILLGLQRALGFRV